MLNKFLKNLICIENIKNYYKLIVINPNLFNNFNLDLNKKDDNLFNELKKNLEEKYKFSNKITFDNIANIWYDKNHKNFIQLLYETFN